MLRTVVGQDLDRRGELLPDPRWFGFTEGAYLGIHDRTVDQEAQGMSGLPLVAVLVVLASALLHATWNLLLSRVPKGHDTTAVATTLGLLAWTPIAVARWHVEAGVWPYILGSSVLELAYFAALNLAYAKAPAHAVYPVARGLAPALLLPIAAVAGFSWWTGGGVLAVTPGVLLTTGGEADRRSSLSAVPGAARP